MIRLRTHLRNIGPHHDTTIEWPVGISALVAPNGSGKTFALEAAIAAPYGLFPSRAGLGSIYERMRHGSETAEVSEDWLLNDGSAIRFVRKIDGKNRSQTICVYQLDPENRTEVLVDSDNKPVLLAGPLAKDADPYIDARFGSEDVALASRFAAQNSHADLCYLPPTVRRRTFTELTGTATLTPKSKAFGTLANTIKGQIHELVQQGLTEPDHQGEAARARFTIERLGNETITQRATIAAAEESRRAIQKQLAELESQVHLQKAKVEALNAARAEYDAIAKRIADLETQAKELRDRAASIEQHRADVAALAETEARIVTLEADLERYQRHQKWISDGAAIQLQLDAANRQLEAERAKSNLHPGDEELAAKLPEHNAQLQATVAANTATTNENNRKDAQRRTLNESIAVYNAAINALLPGDRALAATVTKIRTEYATARDDNEARKTANAAREKQRSSLRLTIANQELVIKTCDARLAEKPETPFGEKCQEAACSFLADFASLPEKKRKAEEQRAAFQLELDAIPADVPLHDLEEISERGKPAGAAEERVKKADEAITNRTAAEAELAAIPENGTTTSTDQLTALLTSAREAAARVAAARAAADSIALHQTRINEIQANLDEHHRDTFAVASPDGFKNPANTLAAERLRARELQGAADRLKAAEQALADATRVEAKLAEERTAEKRALDQVSLKSAEGALGQATLDNLATERTRLESSDVQAATAIDIERTKLEGMLAESATAKTQAEHHEARAKIAVERSARIKSLEVRMAALLDLKTCFSESGVQPIIIDGQAANLAAAIDRQLRKMTDGWFSFRILTQSATQTGKVVEDFIFELRYPGGQMDVLEGSGGEIQLARLIIRGEFGKWLAALKGFAVAFSFCLDESLGALDDTKRAEVCAWLRRLAADEEYRQIVVVTHDDTFIASIPQRINLRKRRSGIAVTYEGIAGHTSQPADAPGLYDLVTDDGCITPDILAGGVES